MHNLLNKIIGFVLIVFCIIHSIILLKTDDINNSKQMISNIANASSSNNKLEDNKSDSNLETMIVFHNIEAVRNNYRLKTGMTVQTTGYYKNNDGGTALYTIRDKKTDDVDNDGNIIFLNNGKVAELITDGKINVRQFGAVGDGIIDDTKAIKRAIAFGNTIVFSKGKYLINETLELKNKTLIGISQSRGNETVILSKANTALHLKSYNSLNNITVSRKEFPGGRDSSKGIWLEGVFNRLNNVNVYNHAIGIYMMNDSKGCSYNHIVDGVLLNCFEGIYMIAKKRGWVNENTFQNINIRFNGSFYKHIDGLSNSSDIKDRFAVTMTHSEDAIHQINMNKFLCLNMEGCYNGFSVSAANCVFLSNRTEGNKIGYYFKDHGDGVRQTKSFKTRSNIIISGVIRNIKQDGDVNREPRMYNTVEGTMILPAKDTGIQ